MSKNMKEIEAEYQALPLEETAALDAVYGSDERAGVKKIIEKYAKKREALAKEHERVEQMLFFEKKYGDEYEVICGIDEAGRGPLAGPVVAAAVVLRKGDHLLYVNDSKKLSEAKREQLFDEIREKAVTYGIGIVGPEVIDEINILQATYEAMRQAISQLDPAPVLTLNDAVKIPGVAMKQVPIIKGDAKSLSIAAASILAKVTRDRMMREYDKEYPEYGFAGHKGYGSADHIAAIKKYGPCPIHRRTFIGNFVGENN